MRYIYIYICFIPNLKDLVLVYKIIFKLAFTLQLVEFSNMLKVFSNHIFENPYQLKGGWMGDHDLNTLTLNIFQICALIGW